MSQASEELKKLETELKALYGKDPVGSRRKDYVEKTAARDQALAAVAAAQQDVTRLQAEIAAVKVDNQKLAAAVAQAEQEWNAKRQEFIGELDKLIQTIKISSQ